MTFRMSSTSASCTGTVWMLLHTSWLIEYEYEGGGTSNARYGSKCALLIQLRYTYNTPRPRWRDLQWSVATTPSSDPLSISYDGLKPERTLLPTCAHTKEGCLTNPVMGHVVQVQARDPGTDPGDDEPLAVQARHGIPSLTWRQPQPPWWLRSSHGSDELESRPPSG